MLDQVQSDFAAVVAGAVLAAALLGAAAIDSDDRDGLEAQGQLDRLALEIAAAGCSALHPEEQVNIENSLGRGGGGLLNVTLFPDHLRAVEKDGSSLTSLYFPSIAMEEPVELLDARILVLRFDPIGEACDISFAEG